MAQLASFGALEPIPDLLSASDAKTVEDAMIPSIATANSYGGTLYTVPFGYNSNVLYYNPDLIEQAGLTPDQLPKTWADLKTTSAALTKDTNGDGTPDVYGYAFPAQAPWILEVRLWQSGAELFNSDNTQATFDSDKAVSTFDNYKDLIDSKDAEMVQTDSSLDQLTDLFAAGKVAMFEQSSTAMAGIAAKANFDVGVAQFPTMGDQVYSLGGYNLGVFKDAPSDQQAAAAQFAQWWSTPEVAAKWTSVSNYMPGIQAAWDTDTLKQWESADPRRAVAAQQIAGARSRPNLPSYPEISTDLANAFQATMSGQGDAASNLKSAVDAANGILAKAN
jgi:sn-glycerol 3-phosphate transport system substrate-binding protein